MPQKAAINSARPSRRSGSSQYGCWCRSPICWDDVGERRIIGPNLVEDAEAKVRVARRRLLTAQSRQKSYVDQRRCGFEFQVGDHILLKVSPARGIKRFGLRNRLSPRFVGPLEISERIGPVAYRLTLRPSLALSTMYSTSPCSGNTLGILPTWSWIGHKKEK